MDDTDKRIQQRIQISKKMGSFHDTERGQIIAREILHDELEYHDSPQIVYEMSDAVKNRLLAHARQDASHAVCNTSYVLDKLKIVDTNLRFANFWLLVIIGLLLSHRWWW